MVRLWAAIASCSGATEAAGEMFLVRILQQRSVYSEGDGSSVRFAFHLPSSTLRSLGAVLPAAASTGGCTIESTAPGMAEPGLGGRAGFGGQSRVWGAGCGLGLWFESRNTYIRCDFPSHASRVQPNRCCELLGSFSCSLVPLEVTVTKTKVRIGEVVRGSHLAACTRGVCCLKGPFCTCFKDSICIARS